MFQTIHLSAVDTAKRLRVELKAAFPETTFSIRSRRHADRDVVREPWGIHDGPAPALFP